MLVRHRNTRRVPWICRLWRATLAGSLLAAVAVPLAAQQAPLALALDQAVETALKNYPAIRAAQAQVAAAQAGIDLARTAYLPRTDLLLQGSRATRNNIFGVLLPQSVIPPMSGPVLGTNSLAESVWGSAAGALASWEPFDFGLRRANVQVAEAARDQASAQLELSRLDVATVAADAFLTFLAAQERVKAARASVERMNVFLQTVSTLVKNELRPGAEGSRATAELAAARTHLIQAETAENQARFALAEAIGEADGAARLVAVPGRLLGIPADTRPPVDPAAHPVFRLHTSALNLVRARERALERTWYPRFNLQSAFWGRGTGAQTNGQRLGGLGGLEPDTHNWAVGLTVTFGVFDYAAVRARKQIEASNEQAERARYQQAALRVTTQKNQMDALVNGAFAAAQNTPVQLEAARTTERQARARYQAGLAGVIEVAEAQRLLAQAESDDALARLSVWRALLARAAAAGNLQPFLNEARTPAP